MTKKETLEKWFDQVWTKENSDYINVGFVPDTGKSATGLNKNKGLGPDEFVVFQKQLLGLLQSIKLTIDSHLENGDLISAQCTMNAKDRKTGKKNVSIQGCVVAKIKDDKIKHANNYFDFLHLFEGLGLLPQDSFAKCLSGKPIT